MPRITKVLNKRFISILLIIVFSLFLFATNHSKAAPQAITTMSDKMTRTQKSVASNHEMIFRTPTGSDLANSTIVITFPSDFVATGVVFGDMDLFHGATNPPSTELTLAATPSATAWGAAFSTRVLTLTHPSDAAAGDIAANDYVLLKIGTNAASGANQLVNPTTSANYVVILEAKTGATLNDYATFAVAIIEKDQVLVYGEVGPTITFSLSAFEVNLGSIAKAGISTGTPDIDLTIGTNAQNGYVLYINNVGDGSSPGLYSATAVTPYLIPSATANLQAGQEGYGINAVGKSGTPTINAPFADNTANNVGGLLLTQQTLAHHDDLMLVSDVITVHHKAAVSLTTPAGHFVDTVTYVATGRF